VTREIRVYVEGGGDEGKTKRRFRQGFNGFLGELRERARAKRIRWEVVACGGRSSTYDDFQVALRSHPDALNVLLVDAEGPASASAPWNHLGSRQEDRWENPGVSDDQCHLMIQMMEAWLIADLEKLADYYGQGFQPSAIPRNPNVEQIDKPTLHRCLDRATRQSRTKGAYHKTRHAPEILETLRASVVRAKAPACDRLLVTLAQYIDAEEEGQDGGS